MEDIYVYFVDLPDGINEMVAPCFGGYTVYIDEDLDEAHRMKAYHHAMEHIERNDFGKESVQKIEGRMRE